MNTEIKNRLWKYGGPVLLGLAIGGTCTIFSRGAKDTTETPAVEHLDYPALFSKVSVRADTNNDGMTSSQEWASVYRELGVHFDELNPERLSQTHLEDYLSKKK